MVNQLFKLATSSTGHLATLVLEKLNKIRWDHIDGCISSKLINLDGGSHVMMWRSISNPTNQVWVVGWGGGRFKNEMHFAQENTYLAVYHHLEHPWYINNVLSGCCNFHYVSSNCLYSSNKICNFLTGWSIFIIMWRNNKFTFLWPMARNKAHKFVCNLQTNKFVTTVAIWLSTDTQWQKKSGTTFTNHGGWMF